MPWIWSCNDYGVWNDNGGNNDDGGNTPEEATAVVAAAASASEFAAVRQHTNPFVWEY